ncbi:hypothetical protein GGS21DRAFT_486293 [Xylaria nigripes]|nr:hypothetical protein GGS21DRAFT_486293 [Xylaria nigripes]
MARSRQTSKLQRATEADLMDLLRSIHGEPKGEYVDRKLWTPKYKHKDTLPQNITYFDSSKSVNYADRLLLNRDGPDEIPGRAWRAAVLHGLINAQLKAHARDWFASTEMVAMTVLLLSGLSFVARDSQFGGIFNEPVGFSKSLSSFTVNEVLKGAQLAVFGGVRDAGTNCPHWYVMMVDISKRVVYFFDSLPQLQPLPSHERAFDHLVSLWSKDIASKRSDLPPPAKAKVVRLSMQEDGWSCGLRCVINILLILYKPKTTLELFHSKKFSRDEEMNEYVAYLSMVTRWKVPKNWAPPVQQFDEQPLKKEAVKDLPKKDTIKTPEQGTRRSARLMKATEMKNLSPAKASSPEQDTSHHSPKHVITHLIFPSIETMLTPKDPKQSTKVEYEIIPFTPINKPPKQLQDTVIKKMPSMGVKFGTVEDLSGFLTQIFSYYDQPLALPPPTQPHAFRREVDINNPYLPVQDTAAFFAGAVNPITNNVEPFWCYDYGRHFVNAAIRIARHSWWNEDEVSAVLRVFLQPFKPNGQFRPTTIVERRFGDFVGGQFNNVQYRDSTFDEQIIDQRPELIVLGRHRENHWYSIVVHTASHVAYVFNSIQNEYENLQEDLRNIQTGYQSHLPGLEPPHTIMALPSILQTSNWECGPLTVLTLIYAFTSTTKLQNMFSNSNIVEVGPPELSELQNLLSRYVGVRFVGNVSRYSEPPAEDKLTEKKLLPSRSQRNAPKQTTAKPKTPKTPRKLQFSDEMTSPSDAYKGVHRSGTEGRNDNDTIIPDMEEEPEAFKPESDSDSDILM